MSCTNRETKFIMINSSNNVKLHYCLKLITNHNVVLILLLFRDLIDFLMNTTLPNCCVLF
jgi:hypothetical protein